MLSYLLFELSRGLWIALHWRAIKSQASLRKRAGSSETSLLAFTFSMCVDEDPNLA